MFLFYEMSSHVLWIGHLSYTKKNLQLACSSLHLTYILNHGTLLSLMIREVLVSQSYKIIKL